MKTPWPLLSLVLALCFGLIPEKPTDPPNSEDFTVCGEVKKVFKRDSGDYHQYVVQIKIDQVDKGKGYVPGHRIYAYGFQRKKGAPLVPSASGHDFIPREGQRVRAKIKFHRGEMEVIYPHGFEKIGPMDKGR